jgi:hypothetical protein
MDGRGISEKGGHPHKNLTDFRKRRSENITTVPSGKKIKIPR